MHREWIPVLIVGLAGCGGGGGGGAPDQPPLAQTPTVTINDIQIAEGNSSTSAGSLTVTLSAAATGAVAVSFRTENGTAVAGEDYLTNSGTLTIPVGQMTATISVNVIGDTTFEPDETVKVLLANVTNATLTDAEGVITIRNDDLDATAAYKTAIKQLRADLLAVMGQQQSFGQVFEMDLDADGDIDLLQLNTRNAEETKEVAYAFRNLNNTAFSKVDFGVTAYARSVAVADFNNDGREDIFLGYFGYDRPPFPGGQDQLLLQSVNGDLYDVSATALPQVLDHSHGICSADLNGDGRKDIVKNLGGYQKVLVNTAGGRFVEQNDVMQPLFHFDDTAYKSVWGPSGYHPMSYWQCATGDFNADGVQDVILGGGNTDVRATDANGGTIAPTIDFFGNLVGPSNAVLLGNRSTGKLEYKYPASVLRSSLAGRQLFPIAASVNVLAEDLNKDGCLDSAVYQTNYTTMHNVDVFFGNCAGGFARVTVDIPFTGNSSQPWSSHMKAVDIDSDGYLDIVAFGNLSGSNSMGDVHVLENNRANGFSYRAANTRDFPRLPLAAQVVFDSAFLMP